MNFAGGDAFLKNLALRTKFRKLDFADGGAISEKPCGPPKIREGRF